ncbi:condensin-2 complex subunit D3 [Cynara cardunculus var. scolymus]|uniref:condensin-2 complex subunit D3 n=1 Tax=Cynara cardunculus var. scolymus TaxID=59895 RepID=UPI000D62D826|nr:condensin-2 complex subunit D3 [Cynara cardunculus var. scolymus]
MEEAISQIVTELEAHRDDPHSQRPVSESTLLALQTLLDYTIDKDDPIEIENLSEQLSSKNLSLSSSLLHPLTSAMDSKVPHHSLLASKVYLSLLLTPNFHVLSLFTPMAFLSLLRTVRCSFKNSQSGPASGHFSRKKRGGGSRGRSKNKGNSVEAGESDREAIKFDIRALFPVLERLHLVLGLIHLDRFPDSLKALVQTMAEIPVLALESCGNSSNYNRLCNLCSDILSELLKSEHGEKAITAAEILKSLSSIILLKSQARTFGLAFVVNRMAVMAKDLDEIRKAMVNLSKYLVGKAPEGAEPRALAVQSILEIVRALEYKDQIDFADYVVKMTCGKPQLRLLAVDLIPTLIMSFDDPLVACSETGYESSWGFRCLHALLQRCSDATAGIRARALTNMAQLVGYLSRNEENKTGLMEVIRFGEDGGINDVLRKRCVDEKAAVRKAALVLISKLTALQGEGGGFDDMLLNIMGMACSDQLVSIRKAAISALSETFRKVHNDNVTKEWLRSVPRLIADNESSIQEECENLFLELVLDRISRAGSNVHDSSGTLGRDHSLLVSDGVLGLLKEICNGEVAPWVKKICINLGKKKKLRPIIAVSLQNIIRKSEYMWLGDSKPIEKWIAPAGAWFLLSEVSGFLLKTVDWEFLYLHWQLLDKHESSNSPFEKWQFLQEEEEAVGILSNSVGWAGDRVYLLQTISNVSVELPAEPAADLAHNLLKRIEDFSMHSMEVNAHVKALKTLCKRKAKSPEEADTLVIKWVHQLLSKASDALEMYMAKDSKINKGSSLLTPPSGTRKGDRSSTTMSRLLAQAISAVYTIGSLVIVCPSADLKAIIPTLHNIITSGVSDPKLKKLSGMSMSVKQTAPSLYIQAWLTMGKICLADGKLAKRYMPLFVQEMEKSNSAALRNNIVVMMADFCVRYTALVDCYISNITKCLRDPCELVRRQTFTLLSRLLQRDYVKWRGVLFLRFLLSLVDESEKIRQLADYLFGNILKVKAPLLAYNSFVKAIFVLNDCDAHTGQTNSQKESHLFSIRGNDEKSRCQRMHIYVSLLKQMAPEHLLATFAKVCAEILASASDGMLNIEDVTSQSVLQDAFQILSCKEIRIPVNKGSSLESSEMEEVAENAAVRGRVITQVVKKGLIQNTIPIFIELKRLLESKNSPLSGSLMECLRILLKDYKNEIDEMLVADKQLQKELIYDIQKYESLKAKSTAAEAVGKGLHMGSKVTSAVAGALAEVTARSVLRDVNQGAGTPSLSAMNVPKLKSSTGTVVVTRQKGRSAAVLESLRRRQSFDLDDES